MKTFHYVLALLMLLSTMAEAQDAKLHLRDFRPKYTIDTFQLAGNTSVVKRRVIDLQKAEGIKSAYWDEASAIVTVQYNQNITQLSAIKDFFLNIQPLATITQPHKPVHKLVFGRCTIDIYSLKTKNRK